MTTLERLKLLVGAADDAKDGLLNELLTEAQEFVLLETGRREVPAALLGVTVRIAASYYQRVGMEGLADAKEGGISRTVDAMPEDVRRALAMYRVARLIDTRRAASGGLSSTGVE